jgi:hypothetical protein
LTVSFGQLSQQLEPAGHAQSVVVPVRAIAGSARIGVLDIALGGE